VTRLAVAESSGFIASPVARVIWIDHAAAAAEASAIEVEA
jgi:hypothetical protein